jgi:cell division protease FtsH
VKGIVEGQYERARRILTEHKDKLTALATQLLEKEVIFKEDLEKIFGDRPFARPEPAGANGSDHGTVSAPTAPPADEAPAAG